MSGRNRGRGNTQQPTTPFTFAWGDGTVSKSFFPATHTYSNTSTDYVLTVTAHYAMGTSSPFDVPVQFVPSDVTTPVPYPSTLAVSIPDAPVSLGTTEPAYAPPTLSFFPDSSFTPLVPRATVEYVFSQAAKIENAIVEGDHALVNGGFQQVILRDPGGGGESLWFTNPVAVGAGDSLFSGHIDYSSIFHEMGHNFSLNSPAGFRYGGKIDGNANAVFSEAVAQMFQHATAYEIMNHAPAYGVPPDLAIAIAASAESSMSVLKNAYLTYVAQGKPFTTWNDPATSVDETFGTFMTIAYEFCKHAEAIHDFIGPLRRVMRLLRTFNPSMLARYAPDSNTAAASTFRSTLMVAALSYGFSEDLRGEFRNLGFPIDDATYTALYNSVP